MANLLVVHGGAPTAVMNASLYGVIEQARSSGQIGKVLAADRRNGGDFERTLHGSSDISGDGDTEAG